MTSQLRKLGWPVCNLILFASPYANSSVELQHPFSQVALPPASTSSVKNAQVETHQFSPQLSRYHQHSLGLYANFLFNKVLDASVSCLIGRGSSAPRNLVSHPCVMSRGRRGGESQCQKDWKPSGLKFFSFFQSCKMSGQEHCEDERPRSARFSIFGHIQPQQRVRDAFSPSNDQFPHLTIKGTSEMCPGPFNG